MISRIQHYFRSTHIAMTPAMSMSRLFVAHAESDVYPLQLGLTHCRHTYNGSAAIYQAALDKQLGAGDVVLLPAYCCGAELGPFESLGCELLFYDVKSDLSVDHEQIESQLSQRPDIKLLLVTHYLGLAQPNISRLAELCNRAGVALLEDCAHALFCTHAGKALGSYGDYAIFSPRKTLPLTEGGILVATRGLDGSVEQPQNAPYWVPRLDRLCYSVQQGLRCSARTGVMAWLNKLAIALWAVPAVAIKIIKASGFISSSQWLTPDVEGKEAEAVYSIKSSALAQRSLLANDAKQVIAMRRQHHDLWLTCLAQCDRARPLLARLPEGCCPLYFVVEVDNPGSCVEALASFDIEAFNWWQHLSESIEWKSFPEARRLKQSLLALPVHQQLTKAQIESMAKRLIEILE
ncbi:MAG: DegT/DnrJ/EryC1/StrS family aminotransferase [Granulosicoccus sp.]